MRARPRRVLFIQHAGAPGGSAMSLLYTATALDPARYRPVVALIRPHPDVERLYVEAGIETIRWPGIATFEHSTARSYRLARPSDWARLAVSVGTSRRSARRTRALVDSVSPDLVHLNSVVLLPAARALRDSGRPVVWHVREHPPRGGGVLTRYVRRALRTWADATIFISEADRRAWLRSDGGFVVPNFVDGSRFAAATSREEARAELGLAPQQPVVLYLGGISRLKGSDIMLHALAQLASRFPQLRCLMPGTLYPQSRSPAARAARALLPLVGSSTPSQAFRRTLASHGLERVCMLLPFQSDVAPLLAACDVLAFPAREAHFARPAVEAAVMGRPVVASALDGIDEIVTDGVSGRLVPAGDAAALAEAIGSLLADPARASAMGSAARTDADRFSADRGTRRIMSIYDELAGGDDR